MGVESYAQVEGRALWIFGMESMRRMEGSGSDFWFGVLRSDGDRVLGTFGMEFWALMAIEAFGCFGWCMKKSASVLLFGGMGSINLTTGDAMDLWVGILDHRVKESASDLLCWRLGLYKTDDGGCYGSLGWDRRSPFQRECQ